MDALLNVTKCLADESRVRALYALRGGELCVCQITALLELAPSTVSKHMALLKAAGLVRSRKDGRWIYYRLADDERSAGGELLAALFAALDREPSIKQDAKRLKSILKCSPEELCQRPCSD